MRRHGKTASLFGIGALVLLLAIMAVASSACSDSIEQARPVDRDATSGEAASPAASEQADADCWPELTIAESSASGDAIEWATEDDGTLSVRRWNSRTLKTYSAEQCGDAPVGSLLRARTGRQLVWEKTWPDDFREDAVRLGWPEGMVDRCTALGPDNELERLIFLQCGTMEHELFLEPLDFEVRVPPEALQRGPFIVAAAESGRWQARRISYCADLIFAPNQPRSWDQNRSAPSSRDCWAMYDDAHARHVAART